MLPLPGINRQTPKARIERARSDLQQSRRDCFGSRMRPEAFSSEVVTGSREENASKQRARASVPFQ
jgi:hypothetical protein